MPTGCPVTPKVGRVLIDPVPKISTQAVVAFFRGRKAADITTADIRHYIVSRQAGASQEEIAAELGQLQADYTVNVERIEKSECGKRAQRKQLGQAKREWERAPAEAKRKAGASNATVNRELSVLRRAFTMSSRTPGCHPSLEKVSTL